MAGLGLSASGLCDLQAGYHTRPVEEVFDVRVRPLSPRERWQPAPIAEPVLPPLPAASVPAASSYLHEFRPSPIDVSMSDIPGSVVVTYDRHIEVKAEHGEPKALFLKYKSMDPVTHLPADMIVPAELCLDVYVDPNLFAGPPVEEEESEEVVEDKKEDDRRKLKSSIRGDPILLRAGNAPAPEPYLSSTIQDPQHGSQLRIPGRFGVGGLGDGGTSPRGHVKGSAEGCGTVSSFLKSAGRGKYVRPRLNDIDSIVDQAHLTATASMHLPGAVVEDEPSQLGGSICRGFGAAVDAGDDARTLAAHVALHLRRMPPLHAAARVPSASSASRRRQGSAAASEAGGSPRRFDSSADVDGADSESGGGAAAAGGAAENADHGEGARKLGRRCSAVSVTSAAAGPTGTVIGLRTIGVGSLGDSTGSGKRSNMASRRSLSGGAGGSARVGMRMQKVKLRDMDPHISVPASRAPTQRLHCNWPDGLKRSIARHFYGLSPAKILEEEERERLKEQRPASRSKESAIPEHTSEEEVGEDGATPSELATTQPYDASRRNSKAGWLEPVRPGAEELLAQERRMERSIACVGKVPHGLQVRFHANRPGRFVVGRQLPDKTSTERWRLPLSAR
mmetsp:Transcript_26569/g.76570  ORF Transcript_26569/g.76570 Transcript_26569/m.76570 type:complete len:620 (+) Transcript_26569:327-2186(+)